MGFMEVVSLKPSQTLHRVEICGLVSIPKKSSPLTLVMKWDPKVGREFDLDANVAGKILTDLL